MDDMLQKNLYYLYQNDKLMFNQIDGFLKNVVEKNFKLEIDEYNTPNVTYICDEKIMKVYSNGESLDEWIQSLCLTQEEPQDIVIYGLGLTHHLTALIEYNENFNFYIIEPEVDLFVEALKIVDISMLLEHPQVKVLRVGKELEVIHEFHYFVNLYSDLNRKAIYLPYYLGFDTETLKYYLESSYRLLENKIVIKGYDERFYSLPHINTIRNLYHLSRTDSLSELMGIYTEGNALIVGAGPSLEKDIEAIKRFRNKFIVISAGSSVQSLLHYNVVPDLIVMMDPSTENNVLFENEIIKDIPLVFTPQFYHQAIEQHTNYNYHVFFDSNCITNYMNISHATNNTVRATGTVTGTAIQVAMMLGVENIILTGQDFSYPNNQYYSKGAKHVDERRLNKRVEDSDLEIENVIGGKNKTNISMLTMKRDVEGIISKSPNVRFVNSSSLGAAIEGTEYRPLTEISEELGLKYKRFSDLKKKNKASKSIDNEILSKVSEIIRQIDYLIKHCQDTKKFINDIDRYCRTKPNKAAKLLTELEKTFSVVTEDAYFNKVVTVWERQKVLEYDRKVINIEKEPTIVGKSRLINQVLTPFVDQLLKTLYEMKQEFENVSNRLAD